VPLLRSVCQSCIEGERGRTRATLYVRFRVVWVNLCARIDPALLIVRTAAFDLRFQIPLRSVAFVASNFPHWTFLLLVA